MSCRLNWLALLAAISFFQSPLLAAPYQSMQADQRRIGNDLYDVHRDMQDVSGDNASIRNDRAALRSAYANFGQAVDQYGANSSQAKTAEAGVDRAQMALHQAIGDYKRDKWDAYRAQRNLYNDRARYAEARLGNDMRGTESNINLQKYDLANDQKEMASDTAAIRQDRANARAAIAAYQADLQKYGKDNPQTKAAAARVDQAEANLHHELGDYDKLKANEAWHQRDLANDTRVLNRDKATEGEDAEKRDMARDRYSLRRDLQEQAQDSNEVKQARANLRNAFANYGQAVDQHGANSMQAKAAESQVDHAQIALHQAIGDYDQAKWQATKANRNLVADKQALNGDIKARYGH